MTSNPVGRAAGFRRASRSYSRRRSLPTLGVTNISLAMPFSRKLPAAFLLALLVGLPSAAIAADVQRDATDPNHWPVYRDTEMGFRISHPPDWKIAPPKGSNVRFSAYPPAPPGNCNVVVGKKPELDALEQATLNAEVQSLGMEANDWAIYVGASSSALRLFDARRTSIGGVAAIVGVVETDLQNLRGAFMRKQMVALLLHRGAVWTLNCGASDGNPALVRARYAALSPTFSKIFGSFVLAATAISSGPTTAQSLTPAQIKQIEEIAQTIATQHNANAKAMVDDMTASSRAVAVGRNVRFENVLRVKKGLPPAKLKEFSDETRREIVPNACAANASNPAFDRGLTYTYAYVNTHREKLAEFTVDQQLCRSLR